MGVDAEMFVRIPDPDKKITAKHVRAESVRMVKALGIRQFNVHLPSSSWFREGRHALEIIDTYEQDGPEIKPEPGETFVRCHLATRYYGEGYERGDLVSILAIARWLRAVFPGGVVWYGGDSGGRTAELLDDAAEIALLALLASPKGRAYYEHDRDAPKAHCTFCDVQALNDGMNTIDGVPTMSYYCDGCGGSYYREPATHRLKRHAETFDHQGDTLPSPMLRDALLDAVVQVHMATSDVDRALIKRDDRGKCLEITVGAFRYPLEPDTRIQIYERVGMELMEKSRKLAGGK